MYHHIKVLEYIIYEKDESTNIQKVDGIQKGTRHTSYILRIVLGDKKNDHWTSMPALFN